MENGFSENGIAIPRRVVVLRALKLGDLLCAVPAFRALRATWPSAEIVLIGLPWAAAFVERYSAYLNGFREFPGYPGLPEREPQIERIPSFLSRLQGERFDLAIQLHGSGPFVNSLCVLFGARRTAGFYLPGGYRPDAALFCPWPEREREVTRLLTLVEFLGLPTQGEELEFPLRPEDFQSLHQLDGAELLRPGQYVCLHPGASVPERRWPTEWFAGIGRTLALCGLHVVLTGTATERELTAEVARAAPFPVLDLAGRTDLGTLAALLQGARLLVCNDTGVSHLADALGVPSIVLSTGDNPARWAPRDRRRHRVFTNAEQVCRDEVAAEAVELLNATAPGNDPKAEQSFAARP